MKHFYGLNDGNHEKRKKVKSFDVWCFAHMNNNKILNKSRFFVRMQDIKYMPHTISNICVESLPRSVINKSQYFKFNIIIIYRNIKHVPSMGLMDSMDGIKYIQSAQHTNPLD